jgi:hypothetical protein
VSMCKLNRVKAARKSPGECGKCGETIEVGQPYRWWKGRFTGKRVRCAKYSCAPQAWELETNGLKAEAMQGEDMVNQAQACTEDAESAASFLRDAIGVCESVREQVQERIDNMSGTGLENTEQYSTLQDTLYNYETWQGMAEQVADELEALSTAPSEDDYHWSSPEYVDDKDPEQSAQDAFDEAMQAYSDSIEEALAALEDWPELDLGAYGPPRPRRRRATTA